MGHELFVLTNLTRKQDGLLSWGISCVEVRAQHLLTCSPCNGSLSKIFCLMSDVHLFLPQMILLIDKWHLTCHGEMECLSSWHCFVVDDEGYTYSSGLTMLDGNLYIVFLAMLFHRKQSKLNCYCLMNFSTFSLIIHLVAFWISTCHRHHQPRPRVPSLSKYSQTRRLTVTCHIFFLSLLF